MRSQVEGIGYFWLPSASMKYFLSNSIRR